VIAHIEGLLREAHPTRVIVAAGGVGYELFVPLSTFPALPPVGGQVALHVYTHAREGAIELFGFHSAAERAAFVLLLRANRVGPRLAQTVLSGITPADLAQALRSGDARALRAIPGVGPKLAERILLELRDRADELAAVASLAAPGAPAAAPPAVSGVRGQALSALLNLGYPSAHAERVLEAAGAELEPDANLEAWVRACLKRLAK
jgi:Holliday junction DNA helicase RuvA